MASTWKYALTIILCLMMCTACSKQASYLPGYIEGEYTYIASGISGTLFNLYIVRGQQVHQGDLLYQLDPQPEQANVDVIKANIANQKALINLAQLTLQRQQHLFAKNASAQADLDAATTDFVSKSKQLENYQAQLIQTEWSLQQKRIYAPVSGRVFDTFYRIGEKVPENQPVLAILAPVNIKVLFYIPETSLSQIKLGQKITFSCDGCNGTTAATVEYISPEAEYTPPVVYSRDTRYKLVYLIRAAMPENIAQNFHPGQPIDVYLNTHE